MTTYPGTKVFFSAAVILSLATTSASAHSLWVTGKNDTVVKADIVYGHNFPHAEVIPEKRLSIFDPVEVVGKDYKETLQQKGENYHYESSKSLMKGTYLLKAIYKPTIWSKKADGEWVMGKSRKNIDGEVDSCEVASMAGKSILIVGNDDGSYATQPLGKGLEITPLVKPGEITVNKGVKFQITNNGKPLKMAEIFGSYHGFSDIDSHDGMSFPFYAKSDLKGEFLFKPLHAGLWYLKSEVTEESGNADCETNFNQATLTFTVK